MIALKLKKRTYFFIISFIVTSCLIYGFLGACIAYEKISEIAYGDKKTAVELSKNGFRIFDFEFNM